MPRPSLRARIEAYARGKYEIEPEQLPFNHEDYAVLRHPRNGKWFAVFFVKPRAVLGLPGDGVVEILSFKVPGKKAAGRVPVMAAGGIVDERTARAAFALGAEGLYVGTAFMMAEESPLADNIKQAAVHADALDLIMYRTIPAFYRSLPGPLPAELLRMSRAGATEEEIYKAQHAYIGMRDGMLLGDLSKGFASFGLGISQIHAVEPVATVMDRLMRGVPR